MNNKLKILSFKDFCIRREEVYSTFWVEYAPFFDIAEYRDYLLEEVVLAKSNLMQTKLAGIIWEYLMGDIDDDELINFWIHLRHNYAEKKR